MNFLSLFPQANQKNLYLSARWYTAADAWRPLCALMLATKLLKLSNFAYFLWLCVLIGVSIRNDWCPNNNNLYRNKRMSFYQKFLLFKVSFLPK